MTHYNQLDPAVGARVEELLQRMTLAEKAGQIQAAALGPDDTLVVTAFVKNIGERATK